MGTGFTRALPTKHWLGNCARRVVCCLSELHIEVYDVDAIVLQVMLLRHTLETSVGLDVQRALKWSTESGDSVHKQIRVHGRKGTEEMAQLDG